MSSLHAFPTEIEEISAAIDIPISDWPGNCHGVATAVLRRLPVSGMRLVRGHYDGPVSRASIYRGGLQQHSWLRLEDGRILDPTRWCMDRPDRPYLYLGDNDAYDEAGIELAQKARAAFFGSISSIGAPRPENIIQRYLDKLAPEILAELRDALGNGPGDLSTSIANALEDPVEHLEDPVRLYRTLDAAGLRGFIKFDNWVRVIEPEKITPLQGVNHAYTAPPRIPMTDAQCLFRVFCRFLSIEHRGERIDSDLEEMGYTLEDLHEALNAMERILRHDPEASWMPAESRSVICHVAMDLLGKGFGQELRVERFADSLGLSRTAFDRALKEFAEPAGLDLIWIWPPRSGTEDIHAAEPLLMEP